MRKADKWDKMVARIEAKLPYASWDEHHSQLIAAALRRVARSEYRRGEKVGAGRMSAMLIRQRQTKRAPGEREG